MDTRRALVVLAAAAFGAASLLAIAAFHAEVLATLLAAACIGLVLEALTGRLESFGPSGFKLRGARGSSGRPLAPRLREVIAEALSLTAAETDEFHRLRFGRAWLKAGRAALGSGDEAMARSIAQAISAAVLAQRDRTRGRPWADEELSFLDEFGVTDGLYRAIFNLPMPTLPTVHEETDVKMAFDTLLKEYAPPRRRRRQPRSSPGAA